jgi:hypothetical protein
LSKSYERAREKINFAGTANTLCVFCPLWLNHFFKDFLCVPCELKGIPLVPTV